MFVELKGQVEKITYHNEENNFTIAKLKVGGRHVTLRLNLKNASW
jgi:hypothetical protein